MVENFSCDQNTTVINHTHPLVRLCTNGNQRTYASQPENVGRGSDILYIDPCFLKFSPDLYPKYILLKGFFDLNFHLENFHAQISSSS